MRRAAAAPQLGLAFFTAEPAKDPAPARAAIPFLTDEEQRAVDEGACVVVGREGRRIDFPPGKDPATSPFQEPVYEDPAVIASRLTENAHTAAVAMEELRGLLGNDAARPEWIVYIAPDPVDLDALPVPALVRAVGRYAAEGDVAAVVGLPASRCFALPAYAALRAGAVPLVEHPLRKKSLDEVTVADAFMVAMQRQIARVDEDMAETMAATAALMGCTVPELEARLESEKRERDQEQAARKVEAKARRQPAPKNAVKPAPGVSAIEAGMRRLTDRQCELLALVDVDPRTNRVVYTRDEHVPDWAGLKQAVEALGGKWLGKTKKTKGGWVFPEDVDAMDAIATARETGAILDPKLLGFFATSADLADTLVAGLDIRPGDRVLEPSAGKGALALAVRRACPEARIVCVELLPENAAELRRLGFEVIEGDFTAQSAATLGAPFDCVVMNPPFGKGRPELSHLLYALNLLRVGGRLGAIMPNSLRFRDDAHTTEIREQLRRQGAVIVDNEAGAFRESGTMVSTLSLTLTKRRDLGDGW